jgi:transcription initiation factor IIE alpha subunit
LVTITCPWCDEDGELPMAELAALEASFTCPDCGTSVELAVEAETVLDLAA